MHLTPDGDMVLAYAKSILRLHDELLSRLSSPEVQGHVVLGTPDLYAAYMLPSIPHMNNVEFRPLLPGIKVNTSPANYRGYNQMQLVKFDGRRWVPFGDIIGE
jgi:DNA-binding transcriptional LysR family regulator